MSNQRGRAAGRSPGFCRNARGAILAAIAWVVPVLLSPILLLAQAPGGAAATRTQSQLPDGPGKEVTQKICGVTCHGPELISGAGYTRDEWAGVVNAMVARGAKATNQELVQIVQYLAANVGPNVPASAPVKGNGPATRPTRGPGPLGGGAADSHIVDRAGVERGKALYIAECITCHGNKARGANANVAENLRGADLIRSLVVLHDRYGSTIGPFLLKGHPLQSGKPASSLTTAHIGDLAHFLHDRVYETLRTGSSLKVLDVLTGDPKAGADYFNGAGKCSTCHSPSGDLKGIGSKYDPPTMQSKFLFPKTVAFGRDGGSGSKAPKQVTVTVTKPNGEAVTGVLDRMDDFNVSLRTTDGEYLSFTRTSNLKVEKHDPYAAHVALLDQYTDKNMHDIVAYLESLK